MFVSFLQVTRNLLPRHLLTALENCRLHAPLKSGFRKTGLFPYNPTEIKKTLAVVVTPASLSVVHPEDPRVRVISEKLVELGIKKQEHDFILSSVIHAARGESIGVEVSLALAAVLLP